MNAFEVSDDNVYRHLQFLNVLDAELIRLQHRYRLLSFS
jgi:hypothetical protein